MAQPHWNINDPDAKRYAQALANALRHLKFEVAQKYMDFTAFLVVMGEMELPRILISAQLAQQQRQPPRRGPAQVFQFTNPNPPNAPAQTPQAPTPPPSSSHETAAGDYPVDAVFPLGIEPDTGDGAA